MAWRWVNGKKVILSALPAQGCGWFCNECMQYISEEDGHYHCFECAQYDLCKDCAAQNKHSSCELLCFQTFHSSTIFTQLKRETSTSLAEFYHTAMLYFNTRPFLGTARKPLPHDTTISYQWITYKEMHLLSIQFYLGIHSLLSPIEKRANRFFSTLASFIWDPQVSSLDGTFLGICSRNCIEWVISDFGSVLSGIITAPIHVTFSIDQKKSVLFNSKMNNLVVGTKRALQHGCGCKECSPFVQGEGFDLLEEFLQIKETSDDILLKHLITIETPCISAIKRANIAGMEITTFSDLLSRGNEISEQRGITNESLSKHDNPAIEGIVKKLVPSKGQSKNQIFTIMYTSGSTGAPKGVVISKEFWLNFVHNGHHHHDPLVTFSFCPLAHGMDRKNISATFGAGGRVALYEGTMDVIMDHIKTVGPSVFAAIPRFWNKIHSSYENELKQSIKGLSEEKRKQLEIDLLLQYSESLGPRLKEIITGGAPTSPDVLKFLEKCFSEANVSDGYGATEVGGITHNQRIVPTKGTEIRLEEVPEMGYFLTDKPFPRGEICVKKAHMMSEYYNNPEATTVAFTDDGFFRTGDIGEMFAPDQYKLIARKKHIFKLAQGEFIAPESLENSYQSCGVIDQILVYGNPVRDFLLAVVVPNQNGVMKWYNENPEMQTNKGEFREICQFDETKKFLLHQLYCTGLSKSLVSYEYIRGIIVEPEPFSLENNKLTGPFKVNRRFCEDFYRDSLEECYTIVEKSNGSEEVLQAQLATIVEETITDLANHILGVDGKISMDSNLLQFGLDSLSAMKLSNQIHQTLGRQINVSSLLSAQGKLADLASAVSNSSQLTEKIIWEQEAELPADFQPKQLISLDFDSCHVLLTGVTGFIGSCLLETLLSCSLKIHVSCVVRKQPEQIQEILKRAWGISRYSDIWNPSRVNFIVGDLSLKSLGLSSEQLEGLADDVDIVLHCGAHVHSILPYSALKATNVNGTLELLKLCCYGRPKIFHFVSTAGTLIGIDRSDAESCMEGVHPMIEKIGGYSQSKWVSERLVAQAHARGLCATISRPSRVSPHSKTGYWNANDFMLLTLQGIIQMRVYPKSPHVHWNLSAVDFVSEAIIAILQENLSHSASLKVYNINFPHETISMDTLIEWAREEGYGVFPVEYAAWCKRLDYLNTQNPLVTLRETFQSAKQFPQSASPPCKELYSLVEKRQIIPRGLTKFVFHILIQQMRDCASIPPKETP